MGGSLEPQRILIKRFWRRRDAEKFIEGELKRPSVDWLKLELSCDRGIWTVVGLHYHDPALVVVADSNPTNLVGITNRA